MSSFFISMEGIDGCGKSTQMKLLAADLAEALGQVLYVTKEPGDSNAGSNVGPGIRSMLFGTPGTKNIGPGVADLLFLADHLQNTYDIRKALLAGKIVLTDRYADSQFAYSASEGRNSPAWANTLYRDHYGPQPDLTLLFIVRGPLVKDPSGVGRKLIEDISWALRRANARRGAEAGKQDGKAWNDLDAQRAVQLAYIEELASLNRTVEIHVEEGDSVEDVHAVVKDVVFDRIQRLTTIFDVPDKQVA